MLNLEAEKRIIKLITTETSENTNNFYVRSFGRRWDILDSVFNVLILILLFFIDFGGKTREKNKMKTKIKLITKQIKLLAEVFFFHNSGGGALT